MAKIEKNNRKDEKKEKNRKKISKNTPIFLFKISAFDRVPNVSYKNCFDSHVFDPFLENRKEVASFLRQMPL